MVPAVSTDADVDAPRIGTELALYQIEQWDQPDTYAAMGVVPIDLIRRALAEQFDQTIYVTRIVSRL
jgi:hypothetical protein